MASIAPSTVDSARLVLPTGDSPLTPDLVASLAEVESVTRERQRHADHGAVLDSRWQAAIMAARAAGWSQRKVAKSAGVTRARIQQIEKL
jgi:ribosome-binding protein aMBF1 (putative translation factor)